ncbi:MAG: magnesium/cobalt transporter CorA [Chitinophagaceae bacterium]|jgi:magnesium transporter|nr:magnesium/cobalt transporter CorA [Chitinophagaceae bacterium]
MHPTKYLKYFNLFSLFDTKRTRDILKVNQTINTQRTDATTVTVDVYEYTPETLEFHHFENIQEACTFEKNTKNTWINIDGIRKNDVELIANHFEIHPLFVEDILSIGSRPKMDETENYLFCQLNMLYFNDKTGDVEQEQISILLGKNFVISFQEDPTRDVFNAIRDKLKITNSKLRQSSADYLCYALIDMIVDHYFLVMEKLAERIELLEEKIIRNSNTRTLAEINDFRKELIVLKRNVVPVRDLVNGFIKSDSALLQERTTKYFKDVYDHILQANEFAENYRDMMMNLQDLYLSNVNLKMNEVMKVMAVVTCLLAPATVIGGIFGMNFDVIPIAHQNWGFYSTVGIMVFIPLVMIIIFKRRGWF